jgi:hypothetical protein
MRAAAVLLLLLTAGPAAAQGLDCRATEGGRSVCSESFRSLADRIDRRAQGRAAAPSAGPSAIAPRAGPIGAIATAPPLTARQHRLVGAVARAIRAGRCDQARTLALEAGDYPLADHAQKLCRPAR